ncbi:MAG: hypothetical protein M1830_008422 [Pleopsidium flavum]|nr:MAG: hypothetical protein M1830_008422 [Pleopsidium flavum]
MPLELSPGTESDCEAMIRLQFEAYDQDPVQHVLFPKGTTQIAVSHFAEQYRTSMIEDPYRRFVKVTDIETGQIISFAQWFLYPERSEEEWNQSKVFPFPSDANVEAGNAIIAGIIRARNEIMKGQAYAYLATLVTHPSHRGRGAASQLLQWGISQANTLHIPAYLEASPSGFPLYKKHGFVQLNSLNIDLSPWGNPIGRQTICMLKPAAAGSTTTTNSSSSSANITILPVTSEADFLPLAEIESLAFDNSPLLTLILGPNTQTTHSFRANQHFKSFTTNPSARYVKAVDTTTGAIVAWAKWLFFEDPDEPPQPEPQEWADGANVDLCKLFSVSKRQKRETAMKGKPYFLMDILVTRPTYGGRGIGSELLRWGLKQADEKGFECWIDASAMGLGLYKKFGWVEVDRVEFGLEKYGGKEGEVDGVGCMIRQPVKKVEG